MWREHKLNENEGQDVAGAVHEAEPNPFLVFYNDSGSVFNSDMDLATLKKLGPIALRRENSHHFHYFPNW